MASARVGVSGMTGGAAAQVDQQATVGVVAVMGEQCPIGEQDGVVYHGIQDWDAWPLAPRVDSGDAPPWRVDGTLMIAPHLDPVCGRRQ